MVLSLVLSLLFFLALWLLYAYWQERKFRKKPFYGLRDIGWRTWQPPGASDKIHSLALVGDIGSAGTLPHDPVLQSIQHWLTAEGSQSTLVFLGDNIYPVGLPPQGHRHHTAALQKISGQLALFQHYDGKVIYLSGNHDWNKGRKNGLEYVLRQEAFITQQLQDPLAYLPPQGSLGPVEWEINDHLLLIIINSQWWVQKGRKSQSELPEPDQVQANQFFKALQQILDRNTHRFVVIAAHHPLYSNALHGGKFTVKQQLFPLTFWNKKALVPLPLTGLGFQLYRKYIGATEDMSFPPYKRFRKRMLQLLHQYRNVFYVGGHDHNLQYFQVKGSHYAVSGAGSKTNFVAKGGKATFSHENKGFMVLDHYTDGSVWLRVLEPTGLPDEPTFLVFQKRLYPV